MLKKSKVAHPGGLVLEIDKTFPNYNVNGLNFSI